VLRRVQGTCCRAVTFTKSGVSRQRQYRAWRASKSAIGTAECIGGLAQATAPANSENALLGRAAWRPKISAFE
jgi:hypothetical protein